jgi:hypothetical protein
MGLQLPPLAVPEAGAALERGAAWVVVPLWETVDPLRLAEHAAAGLAVVGIVDRRAWEAGPLERTAALFGPSLTAIVAGNEPDGSGPASWTMDQAAAAALLGDVAAAFRAVNPSILVGWPGLISGQPAWAEPAADAGADVVLLHLYAATEETVGSLLENYRAVTPLPLVISECWPDAAVARAARAAGAAAVAWWLETPGDARPGEALGIAGHDDLERAFSALAAEWMEGQVTQAEDIAALKALAAAQRQEIQILERQQSLQTAAIRRILEGRWQASGFGAESAEAELYALDPTLEGQVAVVPFP